MSMKEEPYCYRCGADKKEVCRDRSRLSCSAWGTYYGRHLWTDAKRPPKATDDAFIKLTPTTEELSELEKGV